MRTNASALTRALLAALVLLALTCAGCASKTTTADSNFDRANALRKEGRINDALPYYTKVIHEDRLQSHKAMAYYYRGYCHEQLSDFSSAYRDYLASQAVACHISRDDLPSTGKRRGMLMYSLCSELAPKSVHSMREKISKDMADWAEREAKKNLPASYFGE